MGDPLCHAAPNYERQRRYEHGQRSPPSGRKTCSYRRCRASLNKVCSTRKSLQRIPALPATRTQGMSEGGVGGAGFVYGQKGTYIHVT